MKSVRNRCAWRLPALTTALLAMGLSGCRRDQGQDTVIPDSTDAAQAPAFSHEVQVVLDKRLQFVEKLAAEKTVVQAVRQANRKSAPISDAEITRLDKEWQQADLQHSLVKALITSPCAQFLVDFQEDHPGYPEIFVTDARGLIVAATNKTSDYWQADESWWQTAYSKGKGKSHHGEIEYDESAHSESISLNVPVLDPESGQAIGVVKAVCDITAIKMEL